MTQLPAHALMLMADLNRLRLRVRALQAKVAQLEARLPDAWQNRNIDPEWDYCPSCGSIAPLTGPHAEGCPLGGEG